ncbi:hypothetical protein [Mucilaginibacter sp. PPCGB 2223]|uniref:hypothetical protein n=1 Tax=Mucilaginibacter sp. PPCGB 2223 TaxID=1886027 RepID=UPI0015864A1F|nr:hypothetical protein [Mucilaginibacter sp. PPCGB 2223]
MYYSIFLALFLALACPSHRSAKTHHSSTVMAQDSIGNDGSGGDEGHFPPH